MMTGNLFSKSLLMRSCAPAAFAGAALALPLSASAQGYNAFPDSVSGNVTIDDMVPGETTVSVQGDNAAITWIVFDDNGGNALPFLPDGNTATYLGAPGESGFAVLNTVITNDNSLVQFQGLVQSFLTDPNGSPTGAGGFVAFYSPSGILVGATAQFEVPQLVLSGNLISDTSIPAFVNETGPLQFFSDDFNGPVTILSGATINATPEGSYLIVNADEITMGGDVRVNGSVAYVSAISSEIEHSSGLFDIVIIDGTEQGSAITHTGSTGGPASTGAADRHMIYGVTKADPNFGGTSMLFSGNLGFDPAVAVGVRNGEVILSANYDVSGDAVDGGLSGLGANSEFNGRSQNSSTIADILIENVDVTSDFLAIGTHQTNVTGNSTFSDDLVVVGREQALIAAEAGVDILIGGDLYASARNYGNLGGLAGEENATGGFASVYADFDSSITVDGFTFVTAGAVAGVDGNFGNIGSAFGGQAQVLAEGGTITLNNTTIVEANADTDQFGSFFSAGNFQAGSAELRALQDGFITVEAGLGLSAAATSPDLTVFPVNAASPASGGAAIVSGSAGGGSLGGNVVINGPLVADVSGLVGDAQIASATGATGTGGSIVIEADAQGSVQVGAGQSQLFALGQGGSVIGGGDGGQGSGGTITLLALDAGVAFDNLFALAGGFGGEGADGGVGLGGQIAFQTFSTIPAFDTTIDIGGTLEASIDGLGGGAVIDGFGGTGQGGTVSFSQFGGAMTVTGTTDISASGTGGTSFDGDGGQGLGGNFSVFVRSEGTLTFAGDSAFESFGIGGNVLGSSFGRGGDGTGGQNTVNVDQSGVLTFAAHDHYVLGVGGDGENAGDGVGGILSYQLDAIAVLPVSSVLNAGDLLLRNNGQGGNAGSGDGGTGVGQQVLLDPQTGTISISNSLELNSQGEGGTSIGGDGGDGFGGLAQINGSSSSFLSAGTINFDTSGIGGAGENGGDGNGGDGLIDGLNGGVFLSTNDVTLVSNGTGGAAALAGSGGAGNAGNINLAFGTSGSFAVDSGDTVLSAVGMGGDADTGSGGDGNGGITSLLVQEASSASFGGDVTFHSDGFGGLSNALTSTGGAGTGAGGPDIDDLGAGIVVLDDLSTLLVEGGLTLTADAEAPNSNTARGGSVGLVGNDSTDIQIDFDTLLSAIGIGSGQNQSGAKAEGNGGSAFVASTASAWRFGGSIFADVTGTSTGSQVELDSLATGGDVSFAFDNSSVSVDGDIAIETSAIGGDAAVGGVGAGASAQAGDAALEFTNGSDFLAPNANVSLIANATGGSAFDAAPGGNATAGIVSVSFDDSAGVLGGVLEQIARATTTNSSGTGSSGNATGGQAYLTGTNGAEFAIFNATLDSSASAGIGDPGGTAIGGSAIVDLNNATLEGENLTLFANATAARGLAQGGDLQLFADADAVVEYETGTFNALATASGATGNALGGTLAITTTGLGIDTLIDFIDLNAVLSADGTNDDTAGLFTVTANSGQIIASTYAIEALSNTGQGPMSQLSASGGAIRFPTLLDVDMVGDLLVSSTNGGVIVGAVDPLTGSTNLRTSGTISIFSDDPNGNAFTAVNHSFTSSDIDIDPAAKVSATDRIDLVSLETLDTAVIGGAIDGPGYTLTQAEAATLDADSLVITLPETDSSGFDSEIRDLTLLGSTTGGFSEIAIGTGGQSEIVGAILLNSAAQTDTLLIQAADLLQITLPTGSVRTLADGGALAGDVTLAGPTILAVDTILAATIGADPLDPAIPDLLADDGGAATQSPYLEARTVRLLAEDLVLMQNTGANDVLAGITVGDGGLNVTNTSATSVPVRVILYGAYTDSDSTFTPNNDFFFSTTTAGTLIGPFTTDSTLNNCDINAGTCPGTPPPPPPPPPPQQGDSVVPPDVLIEQEIMDPEDMPSINEDAIFGVDFPDMIDGSLIEEDEVVKDPVTSGGDSGAYIANSAVDDDEEEEEGN